MINKDSLYTSIIGSYSKEEYISLLLYGFIGLLGSILVELIRHKKNIKSNGGFNTAYWVADNFYRLLLSVLVIVIGVLYTQDLVGMSVGNKGAVVLGFCTDKIIETLVSLKLTNILTSLKSKK